MTKKYLEIEEHIYHKLINLQAEKGGEMSQILSDLLTNSQSQLITEEMTPSTTEIEDFLRRIPK